MVLSASPAAGCFWDFVFVLLVLLVFIGVGVFPAPDYPMLSLPLRHDYTIMPSKAVFPKSPKAALNEWAARNRRIIA